MEGRSERKQDLTGRRFGHLTVLGPAENIANRMVWLCRCDCGRQCVVKAQHLQDGRTSSCGCSGTEAGRGRGDGISAGMIRARTVRRSNTSGVPGVDWMTEKQRWRATICFKGRRRYLGSYVNFEDAVQARKRAESALFDTFLEVYDRNAPESALPDIERACPPLPRPDNRLDLTGQRFGQLTVLAPAEKVGSMSAWRCRCDCGKETVVMTGHLRDGHTTSCGCKPSVTLIDGTCVELIQSKTIRRNNTSGVTGVTWNNRQNRWEATLMFKGKRHYLGGYGKFEDAVKARKRAEEEILEPFLQEFARTKALDANG